MVGKLLLRGMLVGIVAGLLAFAFLKVAGEPQVDRAIAFETQMDEAKAKDKGRAEAAMAEAMPMQDPEPELVSRPVQAGLGLFTGVMVYSMAFGGLFALAFALVYGRAGGLGPRATSALLAVAGFVSVYMVPNLKYPANPPSIGDPETIGIRTALYFGMIVISVVAMVTAGKLRLAVLDRFGAWNAALTAGAFYLAAMMVTGVLLPAIDEVPDLFPAVVLWQFRVASFGAQILMWTVLGLAFGALAERLFAPRTAALRGRPAVA